MTPNLTARQYRLLAQMEDTGRAMTEREAYWTDQRTLGSFVQRGYVHITEAHSFRLTREGREAKRLYETIELQRKAAPGWGKKVERGFRLQRRLHLVA